MADERSNLPATSNTLDRAALERVLARASELQARAAEPGEALTEAEIIALGKEVGISSDHLRQALAEERTRIAVPEETGFAGRLFGPRMASAVRTVSGTPEQVLATLDGWMQREECLTMKRRFPDRIVWESRTDFVGMIKRGLNVGGRGYSLSKASDVAATAVGLEGNRTLVRLDADLSEARRMKARESGAVATLGAASSAGFVAMSSLAVVHAVGVIAAVAAISVVPVAAGVGAAYVIAKSHHGRVTRVQLALEQVLDRLEHGEMRKPGPPSLLDALGAVRALR